MASRFRGLAPVAAILLCLLLVGARMVSYPANMDETLVAVPAWNLAHHGFPGDTTQVMNDRPWKGIAERVYNVLPGGILYLAAWFALVPGTILATRFAMFLWAPILLSAYFVLIRRLTGDRQCAALAAVLFGLGYAFTMGAALARVDLMCAALGMSGLVAYCEIRPKSLTRAVFFGSALVVLSCLTHPEGLLYAVALIILAVCLDRRSLSPVHAAAAAIPLAIFGTAWLWYVAQDLSGAISQLRVNQAGWHRLPRSWNPFLAFRREILNRYLITKGIPVGHAWIPKLVLLLIPAGCWAGVFLTRSLRKQPGLRLLLLIALAILMVQTFVENSKSHYYLVHSETFSCALIAVFCCHVWRSRRRYRMAVALALVMYLLINLGGVALRVGPDLTDSGFRSALAFLRLRVAPGDLVIAGEGFWFECCGPGHNMAVDPEVGLKSGLLPDYFVLDRGQKELWSRYSLKNPAKYLAIMSRLARFDLIYDYEGYRIYHLRSRIALP